MRVWGVILLIACTWLESMAFADFHIGPMMFFEIFHRKRPEETDTVRLGGALKLSKDFIDQTLAGETAIMYSSGIDSFATQNSVDEKTYRLRTGLIWRPLGITNPLLGVRAGTIYTFLTGSYLRKVTNATELVNTKYWAPYIGLEGLVVPVSGFAVQEEFTLYYDSYYKAWVYQIAFGIAL